MFFRADFMQTINHHIFERTECKRIATNRKKATETGSQNDIKNEQNHLFSLIRMSNDYVKSSLKRKNDLPFQSLIVSMFQ